MQHKNGAANKKREEEETTKALLARFVALLLDKWLFPEGAATFALVVAFCSTFVEEREKMSGHFSQVFSWT